MKVPCDWYPGSCCFGPILTLFSVMSESMQLMMLLWKFDHRHFSSDFQLFLLELLLYWLSEMVIHLFGLASILCYYYWLWHLKLHFLKTCCTMVSMEMLRCYRSCSHLLILPFHPLDLLLLQFREYFWFSQFSYLNGNFDFMLYNFEFINQ